jgi:SIR2-like protein
MSTPDQRPSLTSTDIDLVLITGAGASREFGANRQKMPLMPDWSDLVVKKLVQTGAPFFELTDLRDNLSGPAFEQALGRFLRHAEAFAAIEDVVPAMARTSIPGGQPPPHFEHWYHSMKGQLDRITNAVEETLVEQFNYGRVSSVLAAQGFRELFSRLQLTQEAPIVWATTNYDPVAELALYEMGRRPECGEPQQLPGVAQRALDVVGILGGLPRQTPVLHLHGKVGWYRDPKDGVVMHRQVTTHDRTFGLPVVMLPDPEKGYSGDDVLTMMWSQFEAALRRARRVLVLGHSLSDVLITKALHDHVSPDRLGIVVFGDGKGGVDPSAAEFHARVGKTFPGSALMAIRFGADIGDDGNVLTEFARRTAAIA